MNLAGMANSHISEFSSSRALHNFTRGLRLIHSSPDQYDCLHGEAPEPEQWNEASLVLMDRAALDLCLLRRLPERAHVLLVTSSTSASTPWVDAARLGVEFVLELPTESRKLTEIIVSTRVTHRMNYKLLVLLGRIIWP